MSKEKRTIVRGNLNGRKFTPQMTIDDWDQTGDLDVYKRQVLGVVWLIAIILQLPKQVRMFLRDREILQGNVPVEMEGAEELFREVCKELGIRRKIRLFANDACYSPVRIRIVRPAVLLPSVSYTHLPAPVCPTPTWRHRLPVKPRC